MRASASFERVLLHRQPLDGRKQINGLANIVETTMRENPVGSTLYIFISKRKDVLKALYWDKSGFALWMKRLENEKFRWPIKLEDDVISLSARQLTWLLDGLDIAALKAHKSLTFEPNIGDTF